MKQVLKWIGIVLGALVGLLLVALIVGYVLGGVQIDRTFSVPQETLSVSMDAESVERGRHWYGVLCSGCHGADLGGKIIFDDPALGTFSAPNLSSGPGGSAGRLSDSELATVIRHGVNDAGRALMIMPSEAYFHLGDEDLGSIIAYMRQAPPVERMLPASRAGFLGRALLGLGMMGDVLPAATFDHAAARELPPPRGTTAEYGSYLVRVTGCPSCHGEDLGGGTSPDPSSPPGSNLTRGGKLGEWTESEFATMMRTCVEPDGRRLDAEHMPCGDFGKMTDVEMSAVWSYLQSLPPVED